ncbi:MAG: response regulator [Sphingopyxis sp.]
MIVADSDVLIRNALAEYLRHCGYKVIEAASSDEVMTALRLGTTEVDAVMADAELAGSPNAFELRIRLREEFPDVTVVLAGSIDAAAKAAGQLCDEGPHLRRPYEPEKVVSHIKRLLAAATWKHR